MLTKASLAPRALRQERRERAEPLRVLLVSRYFPPENVIGAVRVGKFAKFLKEAGHDIRVLAADTSGDCSLPLEVPAEWVTYVPARQVGAIFDLLVGFVRRLDWRPVPAQERPPATAAAESSPARIADALRQHYYALLQIPDKSAGWIKPAMRVGKGIVHDWRPDLVFASGPPHSALIAARHIARSCAAPWIAELRDLWSDNPYYEYPRWRRWLDRLIERRVLADAAGLVTVTPTQAEILRRHYQQPVACVLNGYVEEDFPADRPGPPPGEVVSIVYTGGIYVGYRDPSALFQAIALLGAERERVAVHFYGPAKAEVHRLPAAAAVREQIFVHDRVPYRTSLALQAAADVLLLLQWADPRDAGNIPAKFFEYLGARRPILMLGWERGDLAEMIRTRKAGLVSNDPATIAAQLQRWIGERPAGIPPVAAEARAGVTRSAQFRALELFLSELFGKMRASPATGPSRRPAPSDQL